MTKTKLSDLLTKLQTDYPQFQFQSGVEFKFNPATQTISYQADVPQAALLLLHELSHALLGHCDYRFDIELVKMEADAWEYTKNQLAPRYQVVIDQSLIDETLESYRDWLYRRSCCPQCQSVGYQNQKLIYQCLECGTKWQANDAKFTSLRRTQL